MSAPARRGRSFASTPSMGQGDGVELLPEDWGRLFALETPLLELVARGTILYMAILTLMRVVPRRLGGELAMMDLVFLLLIAEAAAHAMGDYKAVTDGVVVIATLIGWAFLLNVLSYHVPWIERLVSAPPVQVVRDGRLLRRNMRREYLTEEELMTHLRQEGIDDLAEVKTACVEGEGHFTVIRREKSGNSRTVPSCHAGHERLGLPPLARAAP